MLSFKTVRVVALLGIASTLVTPVQAQEIKPGRSPIVPVDSNIIITPNGNSQVSFDVNQSCSLGLSDDTLDSIAINFATTKSLPSDQEACYWTLSQEQKITLASRVLRLKGLSEIEIQAIKRDAENQQINLNYIHEIPVQFTSQPLSRGHVGQPTTNDASWYGYYQTYIYNWPWGCWGLNNCRNSFYRFQSQYLCDGDPDFDWVFVYDRGSVVTNPDGLRITAAFGDVDLFLAFNGYRLSSFGLPNVNSLWYVCAGQDRINVTTTVDRISIGLLVGQR
jgi:hypothetical protein